MQSPWKVLLAFLGVFVAGAVFGGVFAWREAARRLQPPEPVTVVAAGITTPEKTDTPDKNKTDVPDTRKEKRIEKQVVKEQPRLPGNALGMFRQFTQRLNLNPEQREHIRPIVVRAAEDLQRYTRDYLQDSQRVREQMYTDVSAVLTPEQRAEMDQMREKWLEQMRKEREKHQVAPGRAGAQPPAGLPATAPGPKS